MKYLPFMIAFAAAPTNTFVDGIVKWAAAIAGGIIAVFIIVSLAKDGVEYATGKGSTSPWKIVGKVLFLILVLGLIYLAMNYAAIGEQAKNIGENAIDVIGNEAGSVLQP